MYKYKSVPRLNTAPVKIVSLTSKAFLAVLIKPTNNAIKMENSSIISGKNGRKAPKLSQLVEKLLTISQMLSNS